MNDLWYKDNLTCLGGMWRLYHIIVVDKDSLEIRINEYVVAKNTEHALGLVGYYEILEEKGYDNERITVYADYITEIKPIE